MSVCSGKPRVNNKYRTTNHKKIYKTDRLPAAFSLKSSAPSSPIVFYHLLVFASSCPYGSAKSACYISKGMSQATAQKQQQHRDIAKHQVLNQVELRLEDFWFWCNERFFTDDVQFLEFAKLCCVLSLLRWALVNEQVVWHQNDIFNRVQINALITTTHFSTNLRKVFLKWTISQHLCLPSHGVLWSCRIVSWIRVVWPC